MDIDDLVKYMESGLNVLFSGPHGVGKTTMVIDAARKSGKILKYYSAATLDPWADLVGIPMPVGEGKEKRLEFIRPITVDTAEIVFFDELNRSHPKVQNAVMEMIQFKSINGVKLPNLQMVWGAMNPAGSKYKVDELDPALVDRFHIHLDIKADPQVEYFTRINPETNEQLFADEEAKALVEWWTALTKDVKGVISPRRLEYFGLLIKEGIHPRKGIPMGTAQNIPVGDLVNRFNRRNSGKWTIDQIARATDDQYQLHISERAKAIEVAGEIQSARVTHLATMSSLTDRLLMLPKEVRAKMYANSSFRAKIQEKNKQSLSKSIRESFDKILLDSHILENPIVEAFSKTATVDSISTLKEEVEAYRKLVLDARNRVKNSVMDLAPPGMDDSDTPTEKK